MLGVGQGDNVDLFSSSRDCFLTTPHPSLLILPLIHPYCLSLVKGGVLQTLVERGWVFRLETCAGEIRVGIF